MLRLLFVHTLLLFANVNGAHWIDRVEHDARRVVYAHVAR